MSKRFGVLLSGVVATSIICYLAYASKAFNETLSEYMLGYLDNFQKYLFLITIFIVPFFIFLQRQINESLIQIRLKNNVFYYILKSGTISSVLLSTFIYFTFLFWGIVFGLKIEFSISVMNLIFKLFLFVFACYIFSYVIYFISSRMVFGPLSVLLLNFIFLMVMYAFDFFLMGNMMAESTVKITFYLYLFVVIFGGIIYLYKGAKTKECIV